MILEKPYPWRRRREVTRRRLCKRVFAIWIQCFELSENYFFLLMKWADDGSAIQRAVSDLVGRRTVPQVFIHGKHLGGSDGKISFHNLFMSSSCVYNSKPFTLPLYIYDFQIQSKLIRVGSSLNLLAIKILSYNCVKEAIAMPKYLWMLWIVLNNCCEGICIEVPSTNDGN